MKVKDLINKLKECNPEAIIVMDSYKGTDVTLPIKEIYEYPKGSSVDTDFFCKNIDLFKPNKICKTNIVYLTDVADS